MICEDDIVYHNPHNLNIYQIVDNAPEDWGIIRLCIVTDPKFYNDIMSNNELYLNKNFNTWTCSTVCYLINKNGAEKVMKYYENGKWNLNHTIELSAKYKGNDRLPIDLWLYENSSAYVYKYPIFTYVVTQHDSSITNNENEVQYQKISKEYITNKMNEITFIFWDGNG